MGKLYLWPKAGGNPSCRSFELAENDLDVLWEITGRCNQRCLYCYDTRLRGYELRREVMERVCERIVHSPWQRVHLSGGEILLSPYIAEICDRLSDRRLYLTTNLTLLSEKELAVLTKPNVVSIAVSLDALSPQINDRLRGHTQTVLHHLRQLIRLKKEHRLSARLRLHAVITKENIDVLPDLLLWAKQAGIDAVSCQPVHITKQNPHYASLALTQADLQKLEKLYALEKVLFASHYADTHFALLKLLHENERVSVDPQGKACLAYIDCLGQLWNCPLKKRKLDTVIDEAKQTICPLSVQCMTCFKRLSWKQPDLDEEEAKEWERMQTPA